MCCFQKSIFQLPIMLKGCYLNCFGDIILINVLLFHKTETSLEKRFYFSKFCMAVTIPRYEVLEQRFDKLWNYPNVANRKQTRPLSMEFACVYHFDSNLDGHTKKWSPLHACHSVGMHGVRSTKLKLYKTFTHRLLTSIKHTVHIPFHIELCLIVKIHA